MSFPSADQRAPSSGPFTSHHDRIVILDEDQVRAENVRQILEFLEYATVVSHPPDWRKAVNEPGDDVAFVLGRCGGRGGCRQFIQEFQAWDTTVPVYLIADRSTDVDLREYGAEQFLRYLQYPLRINHLYNELELGRLYRDNRRQRRSTKSIQLFRAMVGNSPVMQQVRRLISQVAPRDATVLILGETGTGKEIAARNIHYHSTRRTQPFVAVNCGAIPGDLLESELFGHEKGAFTGAISARQGRFELANGGTLFLDEIGDMPLPMQVKLLRVLQERTFERVGSTRSQEVDVRVIAATHRELEQEIKSGRFREDLYYRLNVFPIEMPPLRQHIEDFPLLVNELVARLESSKQSSLQLTGRALAAMSNYHWPGNVRELANLVERLSILYPFGVVDVQQLPAKFRPEMDCDPPADAMPPTSLSDQEAAAPVVMGPTERLPKGGLDLRQHLYDLEHELIRQAIEETEGVVAHAAKLLGMRRTTLIEKMRKFGIVRPGDGSSEA